MAHAYLYLQPPGAAELVTLGRVKVEGGVGEFVYNPAYVKRRGWVPDPVHYPLRSEPYTNIRSNGGMPGFIRDAAPDGWGQRVITYVRRKRGQLEALTGLDYLIHSGNSDRAGALLVGTSRTPSQAEAVERLDQLDDFLAFMTDLQAGDTLALETRRAVRQRTSLGGARPKVTLRDGQRLVLAKPRDRHDAEDIPVFEHACMTFAASRGLRVAPIELHRGSLSTVLVERFDRVAQPEGGVLRLPMLSAAALLDVDWGVVGEESRRRWRYAEVADEMRRRDVPLADLREFYLRMCFNVLVGNDDDHPKNHAVIFQDGRWRLSPLFDVVPALDGAPPPELSMAVGAQGKVLSRDNLLSHASQFGLERAEAAALLDEVAGWEGALKAHYRELLSKAQAELVIASIDAERLRR